MNLEDIIRRREHELYRAQRLSDVAALDDLIADDLLFTGPDGNLYRKADDMALHREGAIRFTLLEPDELTLRVLNPTTVIVAVRVHLAASFRGHPSEGIFRYTRVWTLNGGRWQIVAGHVSEVKG